MTARDPDMRRRDFLRTLGQASAGLGLVSTAPLGCASAPRRARPSPSWVWVHGVGDETGAAWRARFARLRAAGVHGVLVGGGDAQRLSSAARAEGLAFHRWLWVLNRSGDRWVKEHHPEWFTRSRDGASSLERPPYVGYYQWLCPTRAAVREYLVGVVAEVAGDPAIDGVHLDYVRHCDVILPRGLWAKYDLVQDRELPPYDFCYCDVCRATFRERGGTDPLELPDPAADPAWRAFREEGVTRLVRGLAAAVHAHGKPISAAVFPTPSIARRLVRQAWDEWPLDMVFPMLYHGFYREPLGWIGDAVREGVRALPDATPLYAGLYLPDLPPGELDRAVRLARAAGAAGVALFDLGSLGDGHLAALPGAPS